MADGESFVEIAGHGRLPCLSFGSEGMQKRRAALVIAGRKRATVWDGRDANPTAPGMSWAVMVENRAVAVIETVGVGRRRYDEIDEAFAALEGEGDGSLTFWRMAHEDYFRKSGWFSPEMWLWWEEFRLVSVIDMELAASAADHVAAEVEEARALLEGRA